MRRRIAALALMTLLIYAEPVAASQTTTYTAKTTGSRGITVYVTTQRVGDISVVANFAPRRGIAYAVYLMVPNTAAILCADGNTIGVAPLSCSASGVAVGTYEVLFTAYGGPSVMVTLTITGETD